MEKKSIVDHDALKMIIGRNFLYYRTHAGFSQENLAEKLRINRNYISTVEKGAKYPNLYVLTEAAKLFGISTANLLEGDPLREVLAPIVEMYGIKKVTEKLKGLKNGEVLR